ncbi:MAG: prepilin-type N-terminal cleavage/methylation domain-containing protein [Deltaproteobacteria bacterium]|nr:prepilin-type N-terminal cleavage/methylation domain-containing protein [Deltaproteobacteria bacterium]
MRIFPHSKRTSSGFTLFELLIALAVVTLIVGMVVAVGGDFVDRDLKRTSNQLASTIRYLYNKSILDGIYIRLVFDLEERSYWVEATGDPYLMSAPGEFDVQS